MAQNTIRIYGDFNNADKLGRIRLSVAGSQEDIARLGFNLKDGMQIEVYDHDLSVNGTVHFSDLENIWVVEIDWCNIKHQSSDGKKQVGAGKMDDENGLCKQCGHFFDPHLIITPNRFNPVVGEIHCQVDECPCYSTWEYNSKQICPVCGCLLGFYPWINDTPSDRNCWSCGIKFGQDDIAITELERIKMYKEWRQKWVVSGMQWWHGDPFEGWNPREQLKNIPKQFLDPNESY